jgi:hypothetical protein
MAASLARRCFTGGGEDGLEICSLLLRVFNIDVRAGLARATARSTFDLVRNPCRVENLPK